MNDCYILLGSNLGERSKYLKTAAKALQHEVGAISKASGVYETAAWGVEDQQSFLNQVLLLKTSLGPHQVLVAALEIERSLGRERKERWGSRTIDIDLLFYEQQIIKSDQLTLPHPELHNRRFTLVPLAEIAPNYVHPVLGNTTNELLGLCPDQLEVKKL